MHEVQPSSRPRDAQHPAPPILVRNAGGRESTVLVVGGAVTMAASYASGGIGYYRVKRCRKAIDEYNRQQMMAPPPVP